MAGSTGKKTAQSRTTATATTERPAASKATESEPKRKRTTLTSEQKIKKLEQELADAKRKDAEKREKKVKDLTSKRDKAQEKIDELRKEVAELNAEIERNGPAGEPLVHPAGLNDDGSVKAGSEGGHVDEDAADTETDGDENVTDLHEVAADEREQRGS
jgi:hypothetical protein